VGSNERSGLPLTSREHAKPVWVDLRAWLGAATGGAIGVDVDQPCPGGLETWLRTSEGAYVGVVNVIVTFTDGSTRKLDAQLIRADALRPR